LSPTPSARSSSTGIDERPVQRLHATLTVPTFVRGLADAYGDSVAIEYPPGELTFAELEQRSRHLAIGLLLRGVGKGTRVGIRFGNDPSWVLWWAAVSRIGAICVPISTFLRPPELARVVRHSDLHALVTAPSFLGIDYVDQLTTAFVALGEAAQRTGGSGSKRIVIAEAPFLRWILIDGDHDQPWAHGPAWLGIVDGPATDQGAGPLVDSELGEQLLTAAEAEVHPDDETIIIYTSGQSADPKGVVHTHRSMLTKVHYLREMLGFDRSTRIEAKLPFFWVGGLVMSLFTGMDAGGVVICEGDRTRYGIGQVIGSAAVQANPYPNLTLAPALDMTETFGMYSWGTQWRVGEFDIAAPLDHFQPGLDVKLVRGSIGGSAGGPGVQSDNEVGDGERGEIAVRGASVTNRLHKVDRTTCFDADGYYLTGDEGLRDGQRIHFTGRLGDMIKTSGANVSPAEVERELQAFGGVLRAHVVAIPDPQRDQRVAAAIVADPVAGLTADSIRDWLKDRLSPYKVPRTIVIIDADEIPMTPTMKVNKPALSSLLATMAAEQSTQER